MPDHYWGERDDRTERFDRDDRTERFDGYDRDDGDREVGSKGPPLPGHLARRLLRSDEEVVSVNGPRWSPSWEPFLTHPLVVLVGIALAVGAVALGGMVLGWDNLAMGGVGVFALLSSFGSLILVAFMAGWFTRLVITNQRVMIVQGYEVRKTWGLDELPRSLVRQRRNADGELTKTVDLERLNTMMGGSSDGFVEAKTIWALSKEIDRSRREDRRDERREERRSEGRTDAGGERWGDRKDVRWDDPKPRDGES